MSDYMGKRQYERYEYNAPMYLYKHESQDQYYYANMSNYSSGGMSLKTDEKMDVGQHVYIRTKNYNKDSSGPEKYEEYSGYVIYSNELGTSVPSGQYGYGIKYAEPVYYE